MKDGVKADVFYLLVRLTVKLKYRTVTPLCLTTALQVVDQADATEPEPHLTLESQDTDDLKTEVLPDKQSPRTLDPREKVMLMKHVMCC